MKCQYCGGDISLNDQVCPHCGRIQENSIRHTEEMQRYEAAFEDTRQKVIRRTNAATRGIAIRLAVILVLIGGSIFLLLHSDPYSSRMEKREREANRSQAAFTERIEQYLEERDYQGLTSFSGYYLLDSNDKFRPYNRILWAASYYSRICRGVLAYVYSSPEELTGSYLPYYAEKLPEMLKSYYEETDPESYSWDNRINKSRTEEVIAQMDRDLAFMLSANLGIPQETAVSFRTMTDGQRTLILEEALNAKIQEQGEKE